MLATVYALTEWKSFIGNKRVTVETGNATLSKNVLTQAPPLGYWIDKPADFNLTVVYKPEKQNSVADAISRRPPGLTGTIHEECPRPRERRLSEELVRWKKALQVCPGCATPFRVAVNNHSASCDVFCVHASEGAREGDHVWYDNRE